MVVFTDLIKAFDFIDHKTLFVLLEKIGIPDRPLQAIKNGTRNSRFNWKLGNVNLILNTLLVLNKERT